MFVLQNVPLPTAALSDGLTLSLLEPHTAGAWRFLQSGLEVDPMAAWAGTSKFDLWLSMAQRGEKLVALLEYNTDLFDEETIERMLEHFQTLLEGAVRAPGDRLSQLPLMTEAERRKVMVEWNATEARYPEGDRCLHELFEARAAECPDAVAVVFEEQHLTYGELNRRANQLAHQLRDLGVGWDVLVGICAERSLEMVVGLLGILKAGGAYVPFDPGYPRERLAFMLEDSHVSVLLTQRNLAARLLGHHERLVLLDEAEAAPSPHRDEDPRPETSSDHLAYVIYTSGSTGLPRGR